jgi:branched-chain amino acid transport system substrate-binding protein
MSNGGRGTMMKKLQMGLVAAGVSLTALTAPAMAQDSINFVHNTYRTGGFSGSGIPVADGVRDYFAMLNARDGGIGGVKINFEECETAYDTRRSVECYEQAKAKNTVLYVPWSTGATLAAIPRSHLDKIPILSMGYGLSASAVGNFFPWVFNLPVTYWDGANAFIQHVAQQEGGFDKLKGKTIGLLHLDAPFGKEPIPVLEAMAKQHGFTLKLYPVPPAEMQNQSSMWLGIRRDRTDWVYLQGWGAMNPTAVREAGRAGFPINRLVGVWWAGSDDDPRPSGDAAKGYRALNWHQTGANFPVIQEIVKHVVDKGQSLATKEKVGENLYNRGVYQAILIAEAIRNAQSITGKKAVTGEDVRRGFESLNMTAARWTALGAPGFASPFQITCNDHNSQSAVYVMEWDGKAWKRLSADIQPQKSEVRPLLEEAAKAYAAANAGWPVRAEACQSPS